MSEYLNAFNKEFDSYLKKYDLTDIKTIYIGGGNPGVSIYALKKINDKITSSITLDNLIEYTIECNPVNVNKSFINFIKNNRVNRVSLGIQSFNENVLKFCNRIKQNNNLINNALNSLDQNNINTSIDLINGLPNQEIDIEIENLKKILEKYNNIKHISFYDLSIDEGSYFYHHNIKLNKSKMWKFEKKFNKIIKKYGFKRYEISNYTKKNNFSYHNINYWKYNNYIGLGPGAHSTIGNIRIENIPDINKYCTQKKFYNKYKLNRSEQIKEFILMGFRLTKGISIDEFNKRFSMDFNKYFSKTLVKYKNKKLIIIKNNRVKISNRGLNVLNSILVDFFIEFDEYYK